ncbi:MAG: metalloregulator ArsR/SmtB family transcription factor [Spirochaetota bacterium]
MNPVIVFKSLADSTRIRIVNLLLERAYSVNELVEILSMGQSRISRHLKILNESGLLRFRRDGLHIFYSLEDQGEGKEFISAVKETLRQEPSFESDLALAQKLVREGKKATRRFFNSIASDWESLKRNLLGDFDLAGEIIRRIKKCRTVADLGCGTGDLLPELLKKAEFVIGVDNSPNMLKTAHKRFSNNSPNIQLRLGELEHLPLRDGEADCAVINLVLHHLAAPAAGIEEASRILVEGKTLILVDFLKHVDESFRSRYGDRWLGFSEEDIENWLTRARLKVTGKKFFPVKENMTILLFRAIKQ